MEVLSETQSLDSLVKSAINDAITSENIAAKVKASAEKAVAESIDAAFGYNSDFRKGISKAIAEVVPMPKADDLSVFANAVREVLQRRLANLASDTAREHLDSVLEKLLPESGFITIDELKAAYIDKVKSEESRSDCSCEEYDGDPEITWQIDKGNHDKYWDLWMSPEGDASRYSGKDVIALRFRNTGDDLEDVYQCWNATVGGNEKLVGSLFAGPLYGFDAMVFRLATGTAKLKAKV
jgi:hypothetical protein